MRAAYHHILLLFLFAFHALVLISIPVQARIFPEQLDICNQVPEYNTLTLKSLRSWLCKSATSSMMENSKKGSPSPPPPPKKAPTPIHDSEYPCIAAGSSEFNSLITMVITDHDQYGKKPVRSPPPAPKPRPRPGQLGNPRSSPSDVHGRTSRILPPTPIHDSEYPRVAAGSSECNSLITMVITDHDQYGKKPVRSPPPAPKPRPRPGQLGNPPSSPSDVHERTSRIYYLQHQYSSK
ncbi:hypothetical protein O6P43_017919 [Quillaja saponaria]|uniref:Uncharacterized protein n=1 Tax=Quillaja saponaria TaxID=32244 RepID=A0AAD7LRH2_QUISA|nr:hypothetical protein O6P43_017919 [Quillaja saponaria]